MVEAPPDPKNAPAAIWALQLRPRSVSATNGWARSENSITPEAFTPPPSQHHGPRSPDSQFGFPHPDSPLPSIERGIEYLRLESANTTVSPPPAHDRSTPSAIARIEELQQERQEAATPNGRDSLSLGPQNWSPSPSRMGRPSSSQKRSKPHEVDQEEPPDSRFYSRRFQSALTLAKDLAGQLVKAMSSSDLHTDESSFFRDLYLHAFEASKYSGPKSWKIGFVGDSGAGKSSLINSLLHAQNLAKVSDSGAACTCVATEYHYHNDSNYTIEVAYFTKKQLLEQLKTHLQAYRRFHLHPAEDAREKKDLDEAASTAWHTFEAAFRTQALLTKAYMLQEDVQVVLYNFSSWIDQCAPPGYCEAAERLTNIRRESVDDERACSDLLMQLTSERPDENAAQSWPYIERVNVFLKAHILSKGLILVDLPGLGDVNKARTMITERYIVNCDEIFAIAHIGRAITDAGVKAVIDLAHKTKREHVGIVCTRSDDIAPEEAERDWKGPALDTLKRLMGEVRKAEENLKSIESALEDECIESKNILYFHRQQKIWQKQLKEDKIRLQEHLIMTRNTEVTRKLCQEYRPTVHYVFCVSNRIYSMRRHEDQDVARKWLQLTEIISLRRHCLGLVTKHQQQDACAFMGNLVPNLVSLIDLWVQSGSRLIDTDTRAQVLEASQETERILQCGLGSVHSPSNNIFSDLHGEFSNQVRGLFTTVRDKVWRDIASEAADSWRDELHHSSYGAFCRNYGNHAVVNREPRCWNDEIIEGMTTAMNRPWESFRRFVNEFFQLHDKTVSSCFEQALHPIRAIDRGNLDSVQTLVRTILQRKALLRVEIREIIDEYKNALALLENVDLLSPIRTSLIGQHMESAYHAAAQDYGTGVNQRRIAIISRRVKDPDLFHKIQEKLDERFQTLTGKVEEKVQEANNRHISAIRTALDMLRSENVLREAELNLEFREMMKKQVAAAQRTLLEIEEEVQAAEQEAD